MDPTHRPTIDVCWRFARSGERVRTTANPCCCISSRLCAVEPRGSPASHQAWRPELAGRSSSVSRAARELSAGGVKAATVAVAGLDPIRARARFILTISSGVSLPGEGLAHAAGRWSAGDWKKQVFLMSQAWIKEYFRARLSHRARTHTTPFVITMNRRPRRAPEILSPARSCRC